MSNIYSVGKRCPLVGPRVKYAYLYSSIVRAETANCRNETHLQLLLFLLLQNVLLVCFYVAFPSCPMLKPTFSFLLRRSDDGALYASVAISWIALIWYAFILGVCGLGYFQMYDSVCFLKNNVSLMQLLFTQMEILPQPAVSVTTIERLHLRCTARHRHPACQGPRAAPL